MKSYISILTQSLLNPTHANVIAENSSNTTQGKKTNKKSDERCVQKCP
jgi:hypothetical protein